MNAKIIHGNCVFYNTYTNLSTRAASSIIRWNSICEGIGIKKILLKKESFICIDLKTNVVTERIHSVFVSYNLAN